MVFGHNTNVKIASTTLHVQTEDRGPSHALIDTTVYYQGRVLHRRTNNYFDLLPLDDDRLQALKLRLDGQHQTVLDDIQSGVLQLAIPQLAAPVAAPKEVNAAPPASAEAPAQVSESPATIPATPRKLIIELTNPRSWLTGKRATLQLFVKEESGNPVAGASIEVQFEGSAENPNYDATCGEDGRAQIEFDMPRMTSPEAAIAIRAEENNSHGQLRFALRAKPKVPSL